MSDNLQGIERPYPEPYKKKPYIASRRKISDNSLDIVYLSTISTHFNLKRPENEA